MPKNCINTYQNHSPTTAEEYKFLIGSQKDRELGLHKVAEMRSGIDDECTGEERSSGYGGDQKRRRLRPQGSGNEDEESPPK